MPKSYENPHSIEEVIYVENNTDKFKALVQYANQQSYKIRLIWHYYPYKTSVKTADAKHSKGQLTKIINKYKTIFSDFEDKMKTSYNYESIEIVNIFDLYKNICCDGTPLLKVILQNQLHGLAPIIDSMKLFPHVYEHNQYETIATIDFDVPPEQINNVLKDFHSNKNINIMLGEKSPRPYEMCIGIENFLCITNAQSECCKNVISIIDKYIQWQIDNKSSNRKSYFTKLESDSIYKMIVMNVYIEHDLIPDNIINCALNSIKMSSQGQINTEEISKIQEIMSKFLHKSHLSEFFQDEKIQNTTKDILLKFLEKILSNNSNFIGHPSSDSFSIPYHITKQKGFISDGGYKCKYGNSWGKEITDLKPTQNIDNCQTEAVFSDHNLLRKVS